MRLFPDVGRWSAAGEGLWLPNTTRPSWLDGSLPGDRGFDPLGLAKPTEYLQVQRIVPMTGLSTHCTRCWIIAKTPSSSRQRLPCPSQFDLDSLNQNKAVNKAGGVVGKYAASKTEVTRDSLQPYSEVQPRQHAAKRPADQ